MFEGASTMLSAERKLKIAEIVTKNGGTKTSELSDIFNVSEMTVLRDLASLEKQGVLKRVYGGAVLARGASGEISSMFREKIHTFEKNIIAQRAVQFINEGDSIFLDASTTSLALAKRLYAKKNIVVVANGLDVINEIRKNDHIELICAGGEFRSVTMSFVGNTTEAFLKNFYVDKAFISSAGVSIKAGATEPNILQSSIKKIMMENSNQNILLIDWSKFDKVTLNKVCLLKDINIIITDKKPDDNYLEFFKENNIKILY